MSWKDLINLINLDKENLGANVLFSWAFFLIGIDLILKLYAKFDYLLCLHM